MASLTQKDLQMFTTETGTGIQDQEKLDKGSSVFMFTLKLSMIVMAVFGFLALLWALIQLDTLGPWNIAIAQSITMGIFLVVLTILAIWGGKNVSEDRLEALVQFLTYYWTIYIVTLFWEWFYLKINYKNATHWHPPPETDDAFMGYMAFSIIQIIFAFFFQIYALQLLNSRAEASVGMARWIGLNSETNKNVLIAFKVFTILCQLVGFFFSLLYFFYLTGYPWRNLKLQNWLFVSFGILYLVQVILFWILSRKRDAAVIPADPAQLVNMESYPWFRRHWDELDATQMFLFIAFFINLAVWITFWSHGDFDWNDNYDFGTGAPNYYTYICAAIFNSILAPWYVYYMITSICFAEWIVSTKDKTEYDLANTGPRSLFTVLFAGSDITRLVITRKTDKGSFDYSYADTPEGGFRIFLQVVLTIGFMFQLVVMLFSLITLINTKFLATFWWDWAVIFIVFEGFFFVMYAIKACVVGYSVGKEHEYHKNMMVFCTYIRPLFTFAVCVFIVSFGTWELYRINGDNHQVSVTLVNDATKFAWVKFWSLNTITLGVSLALILIFKDMIGSLLSGASTFAVIRNETTSAAMHTISRDSFMKQSSTAAAQHQPLLTNNVSHSGNER